jgi:hypothetical protein
MDKTVGSISLGLDGNHYRFESHWKIMDEKNASLMQNTSPYNAKALSLNPLSLIIHIRI